MLVFPDGNISDLFRQIQDLPPCRGIVHLWSLETAPTGETTMESLERDQLRNCGSVLELVRALTNSWGAKSSLPKLWLVTRDAQSLKNTAGLAVAQTPMLGLGRTVALEHPEFWGGSIDVTAGDDSEAIASALLAEIWHPDGEVEIALRSGKRYVPRLVGCEHSASADKLELRPDCTYLLTGGLGGLGLTFAKWMVERGARHLVLVGRNGGQGRQGGQVRELEKMGARIVIAQGDVSSDRDLQHILADIDGNLPPLRGVAHLAGVLDDGILQKQSWERFAKVMAPKVKGAWNLHQQTLGLPLDFFVCFSSVASLLGSPAQANYAAANAYLDGIARYRRSIGLPALTVNWSPWEIPTAGVPKSVKQAAKRWAEAGIKTLSPEEGLAVLERLLNNSAELSPQIAAMSADWSKVILQLPTGLEPLFLSKLATKADLPGSPRSSGIYQKLKELPAPERKAVAIASIKEDVSATLGIDISKIKQVRLGFFEMGMDSLMALEFRNRLQQKVGTVLPSTLTFEYPNIEAIADYLLEEVLCLGVSIEEPQDMVLDQKQLWEEEAKQLSDAELSELIDRELYQLTIRE